MATINIDSPLGRTQIDIVKNAFTDKYIKNISTMFLNFPSMTYLKTYGAIMLTPPAGFIDTQIQRLDLAITELNQLGTCFPYSVDPELVRSRNTQTQLYLNDLHRAFTTAHRTIYESTAHYHWSDQFDSEFELSAENRDRFLYLIDQINDMVHATELYVKTDRKTSILTDLVAQAEVGANTFVNNGTRLIKE